MCGVIRYSSLTSGNSASTLDIQSGDPSPQSLRRSSTQSGVVRLSATSCGTNSPVKLGVSNAEMVIVFQPLDGLQTVANSLPGSSGFPIAKQRALSFVMSVLMAVQSDTGIPHASSNTIRM